MTALAFAHTQAPAPRHPVRPVALAHVSAAQCGLAVLDRFGTARKIRRGETLFSEGETANYAYKIVSGALRLCRHTLNGRRQIADFRLPGDFMGAMQRSEYGVTAEAVSDVVVQCYPRRMIDQLSEESPSFRREILALLSDQLAASHDHLVMLGRQSARERVAAFLLMLAERTDVDDGNAVELPMNRQDIADYLGLTIETVCRVLSDLKRARVIGIENLHQAALNDIARLQLIADGDSA